MTDTRLAIETSTWTGRDAHDRHQSPMECGKTLTIGATKNILC